MTQHEYIFVAVSIILGLAITRLLNSVAMLIRVHERVEFHWASVLWSINILVYALQLWWVGWDLRGLETWTFPQFMTLIFASVCIYGAAEIALPMPENGKLDLLAHSQGLGRFSAASMLVYLLIGPIVNLGMLSNPLLPSLIIPAIGALLMALVIAFPKRFPALTIAFSIYSFFILLLTA